MSGIADPFRSRWKRVMAASAPVVHPIDEMSYQSFLTRCRKTIFGFLTTCQILFGRRQVGLDRWCAAEGNVRPREFDHDDVLRIAFDQFWRNGVRGTSLSDIARDAGVQRGEFDGDPETAALHIITVTRGLAVLERAFGDEAQLRTIAAHTVDLVLGRKG